MVEFALDRRFRVGGVVRIQDIYLMIKLAHRQAKYYIFKHFLVLMNVHVLGCCLNQSLHRKITYYDCYNISKRQCIYFITQKLSLIVIILSSLSAV